MIPTELGNHMETEQQNKLLEEVFALLEKLSPERKTAVGERLLGRSSGLTVVVGNQLLSEQTISQVQHMSDLQVAKILNAIAERITTEEK